MMKKSTSFESQLRKAVRRLSRGNHNDSIREVVEHHADLVEEAAAEGFSLEQSMNLASRRMGLIGDIARKIVDSPFRKKKGFSLQRYGTILWVLAPFFSFGAFWMLRDFAQDASSAPFWLVLLSTAFGGSTIAFLAGLLVGTGAFQSNGLKFKSIAIGLSVNIIIASAFLVYATRPGKPIDAARQIRESHLKELSIEPRYAQLESQLDRCLSSGQSATSVDLENLRKLIAKQSLTGIQLPKNPSKYLFPADHQLADHGQLYRVRFDSTNSLKEARLHWWAAAGGIKQDLPKMTESRTAYFKELRSNMKTSLNPTYLGAMIVFRSLCPFIYAIGLAILLQRIRLYRLDAIRIRPI